MSTIVNIKNKTILYLHLYKKIPLDTRQQDGGRKVARRKARQRCLPE